jgi:hypothetical protein
MTEPENLHNPDIWYDEPEIRLPDKIRTAAWLILGPLVVGLIFLGVFTLIFGPGGRWTFGPGGPSVGITVWVGILLSLGFTIKGRFWAYWILIVLLAVSVVLPVINMIMTHSRHLTSGLFEVIALFFLLSGYREYKEFAAYRQQQRNARR